MKKVQFNSVYVNGGQTVVTLFYNEQKDMMWYSVDFINQGTGCGWVNIEVPAELKAEILDHAERVWGITQELYILKCFKPLSAELWEFIEDCWDAIKRQEPRLFPQKDE